MSFRSTRTTSPLKTRHAPPLRVLLVNDVPILSLGIQKLLQKHGQDMVLVGTIQDAGLLHEAAKIEHDVVLLDIDGAHNLTSLRLLKSHTRSRLLAWTRQTDHQTLSSILDSGADGVVPKTVDADALLHILKSGTDAQTVLLAPLQNPATTRRHVIELEPFVKQKRRQRLTPKQSMIVSAIGINDALSTEDLAQQLGIAVPTLRKHIANIYIKLGISNRVALYAYASKLRHEGLQ